MVTGAAGNLGSSVARAFQINGARLSLVDRSLDRIRLSFPDLNDCQDTRLLGDVDLTREEDAAQIAQKTAGHFGRIDVLINTTSGFWSGKPLHETSLF